MKLILSMFIESRINEIYEELDSRNIKFKPKYYITDVWGVPNKVPILGVPYAYCYPVFNIIKEDNLYVNKQEVLKIIRHEFGHCFCDAYKLYEWSDWTKNFGDFNTPYKHPNNYHNNFNPDLTSHNFVRNLSDYNYCYAQVHPDEDWAETFAVWLREPMSSLRKIYSGWPTVVNKLITVDEIMFWIRDLKPKVIKGKKDKPYRSITLKG